MTLFLYCFTRYVLGGIGSSIVYHRILTHRIASISKPFKNILIILSLPSGTPIQWVGTHRRHHQSVDSVDDPHSPVVYGFWFAHCGWYNIGYLNKKIDLGYWVMRLFSFLGILKFTKNH